MKLNPFRRIRELEKKIAELTEQTTALEQDNKLLTNEVAVKETTIAGLRQKVGTYKHLEFALSTIIREAGRNAEQMKISADRELNAAEKLASDR